MVVGFRSRRSTPMNPVSQLLLFFLLPLVLITKIFSLRKTSLQLMNSCLLNLSLLTLLPLLLFPHAVTSFRRKCLACKNTGIEGSNVGLRWSLCTGWLQVYLMFRSRVEFIELEAFSLIHKRVCPSVRPCSAQLILLFFHSLFHSFIHSSIHSFIHSFVVRLVKL